MKYDKKPLSISMKVRYANNENNQDSIVFEQYLAFIHCRWKTLQIGPFCPVNSVQLKKKTGTEGNFICVTVFMAQLKLNKEVKTG